MKILNPLEYSKNIIFSYLNINSIRNKFDSVRAAIVNYVDIFIAAETKIDESFPTSHFAIDDCTNLLGKMLQTKVGVY